jgi:hypothetical protein
MRRLDWLVGLALGGSWVLTLGCSSSEDDASGTPGGAGGSSATGGAGSAGRATGGTAGTGGTGGASGAAGRASSGGSSTGGGAGANGGGGNAAGRGGTNGTGGDASGSGGSAGAAGNGEGGDGGASGPCGAISTFEDGTMPTREIFVDADASGPGDGSEAEPFPTLDAALGEATPGTAIRIRPGSYAGGAFASGIAGTADAPIWIGGMPGATRPVITGGSNAVQLSAVSYLVLHDLEITGQDSNGINVDDGEVASGDTHHVVFRNLFIHDIGSGGNQDCLKLSGVDDFFVLGSEFVGCSAGSAVDHVGCHRGLVAGNTFSDLGGNGVQSKGGSEDIEIRQNLFFNAGERAVNMGGSTGFEFFRGALSTSGVNFEARDIRVIANVFRGGISPVAFVGCVGCLAANNTLYDPEHWVVRILQETTSTSEYTFAPASDGRFVNNVIHYALGDLSTHVNVGGDTSPETFEFANNLWYAHDEPASSEPDSLPVPESDGVYGEDPGFANEADGDFAIAATSPAAGAGRAVSALSGDFAGNCYGAPPSIGAHEVP